MTQTLGLSPFVANCMRPLLSRLPIKVLCSSPYTTLRLKVFLSRNDLEQPSVSAIK